MHNGMMEKVDILLQNWANQEKDHKEKKITTEKELTSSAKSELAHPRPTGTQYEGDGTMRNWRGNHV